jgi:hypothetical protein
MFRVTDAEESPRGLLQSVQTLDAATRSQAAKQ